jgi:hypothetical protein
MYSKSHPGMYSKYSKDRDRDHDRRHHRRFRRGFVFFDDDYYGYDGGSCYWTCRQYRGPAYCRAHCY